MDASLCTNMLTVLLAFTLLGWMYLLLFCGESKPSGFQVKPGYKSVEVETSPNDTADVLQACVDACPTKEFSCVDLEECIYFNRESCAGVKVFCPFNNAFLIMEATWFLLTGALLGMAISTCFFAVLILMKLKTSTKGLRRRKANVARVNKTMEKNANLVPVILKTGHKMILLGCKIQKSVLPPKTSEENGKSINSRTEHNLSPV